MSGICACGGGLVVEMAGLVAVRGYGMSRGLLGGLGPPRCCY